MDAKKTSRGNIRNRLLSGVIGNTRVRLFAHGNIGSGTTHVIARISGLGDTSNFNISVRKILSFCFTAFNAVFLTFTFKFITQFKSLLHHWNETVNASNRRRTHNQIFMQQQLLATATALMNCHSFLTDDVKVLCYMESSDCLSLSLSVCVCIQLKIERKRTHKKKTNRNKTKQNPCQRKSS